MSEALSKDDFGDFDKVGGDRLSPRRDVETVEETDDDADYVAPPTVVKGWATRPSVANQAARAPETVKIGAPVTAVLNLSVPAELAVLNDLQAKAHSPDGPLVVINHIERHFHEGQWHALVTHSPLLYQEL